MRLASGIEKGARESQGGKEHTWQSHMCLCVKQGRACPGRARLEWTATGSQTNIQRDGWMHGWIQQKTISMIEKGALSDGADIFLKNCLCIEIARCVLVVWSRQPRSAHLFFKTSLSDIRIGKTAQMLAKALVQISLWKATRDHQCGNACPQRWLYSIVPALAYCESKLQKPPPSVNNIELGTTNYKGSFLQNLLRTAKPFLCPARLSGPILPFAFAIRSSSM